MKRMLCFLLIAALSFAFLPNTVADEQVLYGDVNGDEEINAKDALLVLRYAVEKEQFSQHQLQAADVTRKGNPDARDALCILQKAVGKLRHFEVEKKRPFFERPEKSIYTDGLPYDEFWDDYYKNGKGAYVGGAAYIRSWDELYQYAEDYGLSKNRSPQEPHELLSLYPQAYFQESSLILFYGFPKYSGLPGTRVTDVYQVENELWVEVLETLTEGEFSTTCDMHSNLCVVEVKDNLSNVDHLSFYVTYQEQWADENLDVTSILKEYHRTYQFYANYRELTWQQPTENERVRILEQEEPVVKICNTYEEYQKVVPSDNPIYSKEYFENGSLILVPLTTPNTGYSYYAKEAYMINGMLHMEWDMKTVGWGGHAVETWYYFLEVKEPLAVVDHSVCGVTEYGLDTDGKEIVVEYRQTITWPV